MGLHSVWNEGIISTRCKRSTFYLHFADTVSATMRDSDDEVMVSPWFGESSGLSTALVLSPEPGVHVCERLTLVHTCRALGSGWEC